MPSPFPGMDPYLEPHWLDVHAKLVTYAADALNQILPGDLVASTEERVAVEGSGDPAQRLVAPDVRIVEPPDVYFRTIEQRADGDVAVLPFRLVAESEPATERFINIIDARDEKLISVMEFVSPSNKIGAGLAVFRDKRADLVAGGVNFIEVDLVRSGNWRKLLEPYRAVDHVSLFRVTIRVPHERGIVQFQPITLREPLPKIPIPLRKTDATPWLELQPLLDRAYDNGRYARRLDYRKPPEPPLDPDDAAWAAELLNKHETKK